MGTQEDIDALIAQMDKNGGEIEKLMDSLEENALSEEAKEKDKEKKEPETTEKPENQKEDKLLEALFPASKKKVVDQLDEITQESEEKVNVIFKKLENTLDALDEMDKLISSAKPILKEHVKFMELFVESFPRSSIKKNYELSKKIENTITKLGELTEDVRDNIFSAMDNMQFQDITRQKIERVISVIKALHEYLNAIFAPSVDRPRARVAHTIVDEENKRDIDEEVDKIIEEMKKGEGK